MLDIIDHIVSIFTAIVMGIIGIYTAYLTLYCKTVNIISFKKIQYSGKDNHVKFVIQVHNKSLSPICISRLYLIFNETHFIELKRYDEPLILQARTAILIEGDDIWNPKFDFNSLNIVNKPIHLLAITNKGISVGSFPHTNLNNYKLKYKCNYKTLIPIEYTSYLNENHTMACVIKNVIEDNPFVSELVIECKIPSSNK